MTKGGGDAAPVLPELAMQHVIENFEKKLVPGELEYLPVDGDPPVAEDQLPVIEDQPVVADQFGQEDHTIAPVISDSPPAQPDRAGSEVRVPLPHNTRLQQRRSESDCALTTLGVPGVKGQLSG
jgi:hypothetical protein